MIVTIRDRIRSLQLEFDFAFLMQLLMSAETFL